MTTREVEEASSQDEDLELVEVRKSINRSSSTNSTFNAVMSYALVLVLLVVIVFIRTTVLPTVPWRDLAVDLLGPLPKGESILVVLDNYSRYNEIEVMKSTTTSKVIERLDEIFSRHGLPESL